MKEKVWKPPTFSKMETCHRALWLLVVAATNISLILYVATVIYICSLWLP